MYVGPCPQMWRALCDDETRVQDFIEKDIYVAFMEELYASMGSGTSPEDQASAIEVGGVPPLFPTSVVLYAPELALAGVGGCMVG